MAAYFGFIFTKQNQGCLERGRGRCFTRKPFHGIFRHRPKNFAGNQQEIAVNLGNSNAFAGSEWFSMLDYDDDDFEFLDLVVETFGDAAKKLIAESKSMKDLDSICYGSLLAACILHCEKHGIENAEKAVLSLIQRIFDERREREELLPVPTDATLH
jgi:hypothetical protein